jgi:hypothetical protein
MYFSRGENLASKCKINLFLKYNISPDLKSVTPSSLFFVCLSRRKMDQNARGVVEIGKDGKIIA